MTEEEIRAMEDSNQESSSPLAPMDERMLITDLTRAALESAAPEELDVFAANERGYVDGLRGETSGEWDEMLGFGLETMPLLTPYVVVAATVAVRLVAQALARSATADARPLIARSMQQLLHREPAHVEDEPTQLPPDVAHRVREVIYRTLREDGLAEGDASLVSDAITGRLLA